MAERNDIVLRENDGPNPPGLLEQLRREVAHLFDAAAGGGGIKYLLGKGEQEVAKAAEIRARVLTEIGKLQIEQQKLQDDRDAARRQAAADGRKRDRLAHEEKLFELRTERMAKMAQALKDVADAVEKLRACGVEIEVDVIAEQVLAVVGDVRRGLPRKSR